MRPSTSLPPRWKRKACGSCLGAGSALSVAVSREGETRARRVRCETCYGAGIILPRPATVGEDALFQLLGETLWRLRAAGVGELAGEGRTA